VLKKKVFMLQRNEQECVPGGCALVIFQKRFSISTMPGMFLQGAMSHDGIP
jgi:hypothetical protein